VNPDAMLGPKRVNSSEPFAAQTKYLLNLAGLGIDHSGHTRPDGGAAGSVLISLFLFIT